jgi:anti-anti-sigma factor
VCLLRCHGPFRTGEYSEYLNAKMDEVKALDCPKVLADFEDVPSVGSSGLSFIVGLYRTSAGRLVLVRIQPWVRKVLEVTRLSTVIPLAPDIESGLAALQSEDLAGGAR